MRAIVSVIGKDRSGIIAKVSSYLTQVGINIEDISQTIMQEFFTMIMLVDIKGCKMDFTQLCLELEEMGKTVGVMIQIQHEDIFNAMHKI